MLKYFEKLLMTKTSSANASAVGPVAHGDGAGRAASASVGGATGDDRGRAALYRISAFGYR